MYQDEWTKEVERLRAEKAELVETLKHIRKIVSPYLIGHAECELLDDAIAKAERNEP